MAKCKLLVGRVTEGGKLKHCFPAVYSLARKKEATIAGSSSNSNSRGRGTVDLVRNPNNWEIK